VSKFNEVVGPRLGYALWRNCPVCSRRKTAAIEKYEPRAASSLLPTFQYFFLSIAVETTDGGFSWIISFFLEGQFYNYAIRLE